MELATLKNFKSYQNQMLTNINPRINVVLGQNGQGKSNFFKAILFALTDKVHLNRNQYNSHLHRAIDNEPQPIIVELYLRSRSTRQSEDTNLYKIERIWHSENSQELRVEEKPINKSDFEAFVQSLGFSFSNSYNIMQQGKVNQVTLMDQFEIYKLLEDATSLKKYDRQHQQALDSMSKTEEKKKDIKELLKQIQTRLEVYQSRKEEFQLFNFQEKANKVRNKGQYQELIKQLTNEMKTLDDKQNDTSDLINKLKVKAKNIQTELEEVNSNITVNQKQLYEHFDDSTMDESDLNMSINVSQEQRQLNSKIKDLKSKKEKLKLQLEKAAKQTQQLHTELKPFKEKYEYMQSLITAEQSAKQNKEKTKEDIKSELDKKRNNIKQIEQEIKKVSQQKSQFKMKSPEGLIGLVREQEKKKQEMNNLNNKIKANKIKYFESNRLKNQYESEVDVFQKQKQVNYSKMRKILPLLQFNFLEQLRKKKVNGVYGFLIQYLEINPDVLFAYEMSGLNKLCTLLVQNQNACKNVIEANRQNKGKQINILPLSFVQRQPGIKKPKPTNAQDCYSLLNEQWIKIKPHPFGQNFTRNVKKIIMDTFNNYVLVKDYDDGLKISKQFHLNCITSERQIVYSEGYLCKVGKDINIDQKLQFYNKYADKKVQLEQSSNKFSKESKTINEIQTVELELIKLKTIFQSELRNIHSQIQKLQEDEKSYKKFEEEEKKLQEKKNKFASDIHTKEQILKNVDKKGIAINVKEFTQVKQSYEERLKIYNKKTEQECQIETKLQKVVKDEEEISEKAQNVKHELSFQKDFNLSFVGGKQFKEQLERNNEVLERKKNELKEDLQAIEDKISTVQSQNYTHLTNISILEDQIQFYSEKLQQLGELDMTIQDVEEKEHSNSFSMSRISNEERKKVRIFSTLEKLTFSKIQAWYEKYQDQIKKLRELERIEEGIRDFIEQFGREKDECIGQIFKNFQNHFAEIFSFITVNGKAEVRLKKINERNRGMIKVRNSISILVSFDAREESTRKWHEFSGGQKTVIAVCMLLALQKCEPAPLYILDEIDAALDPYYLDRIVRLIEKESQHSQYFITSFKQAMVSFPESICNYYLVQNQNRVSSLRRISQNEAESSLDKIIEA